jgi:hypothetical protein
MPSTAEGRHEISPAAPPEPGRAEHARRLGARPPPPGAAGPARGAADLLGLVLVLTAVLKSGSPAGDRRPALPQAAWRWHA